MLVGTDVLVKPTASLLTVLVEVEVLNNEERNSELCHPLCVV